MLMADRKPSHRELELEKALALAVVLLDVMYPLVSPSGYANSVQPGGYLHDMRRLLRDPLSDASPSQKTGD